jgi:orotate phosphoribosyltransferase
MAYIPTMLHEQVAEIVERGGLRHFPEAVTLASGELSNYFVDGKAAFSRGPDLELACRAMLESVEGVDFDAVGGLTMGADPFAHVIAVLAGCEWFVVRKQPKGRGTNKLVEGCDVSTGTRVLLVDDVVTTGESIRKAFEAICDLGATVAAAVTLVDRGETARDFFATKGIRYEAVVTYADLGIPPVGRELTAR